MAQSLHSAYKSPAYDQTPLISARSYYRNFELRYPEDAEEKQIDQKIDLVREQLAYKQYITAEYYERTDHRQAANLYYQLVVDNWPETTAAKMARARIEAQTGRAPALPSQKKKAPRKVLDATTGFLDSWFGLEWLFGGKDEAQSEG